MVRATGGLADTIQDANDQNLAAGTANGFCFESYDVAALEEMLRRACEIFVRRPNVWGQLVETGMRQDWSWMRSAQRYVEIYQTLRNKKRGTR